MKSKEPWLRFTTRGLFTLLALLFVVLILWISAAYPPRARQVPEIVALFSLICLLIQFVLDVSPRLGASYSRAEKKGFFTVDEDLLETQTSDGVTPRLELNAHLWLASLLAGLLLLGFLIFIPFYILLYLRYQASLGWFKSAVCGLGTWLFVYLLFVRLFEIRLYPGMLLESLFEF